ncbi:MAG: hypothetical protein M3R48_08105 [Candidatus Dormibacteraeota bacterium]|nr:hypothetical protein [Candidatus Dormibacteraeota bacterium]
MQRIVTMERWKLAAAIAATLVVGLAIGFVVERARLSNTGTATVAVPTPSASPTLLPTPSASDTPTPTPTPTAAPATPAPTLSAPPAVGNGTLVSSQSGSGNGIFPLPQVNDNWGFAYSFACDGSGQLAITVVGSGGQTVNGDPPFAVDGSTAQGVQQFAKGGNGLQVRVGAGGGCQWRYNVYS